MSGRGKLAGLVALFLTVGGDGFAARDRIVVKGDMPRSASYGDLPNVMGCPFDRMVSKLSTMVFRDQWAIQEFLQSHYAIIYAVVNEGEDATQCINSLGGLLPNTAKQLQEIAQPGDETRGGLKYCIFKGRFDGITDINILIDLGTKDDWYKRVPPALMEMLVASPQQEYMVFTKNLKAAYYEIEHGPGNTYLWTKQKDFGSVRFFGFNDNGEPDGDWSMILTADGPQYFTFREKAVERRNHLLDPDAFRRKPGSAGDAPRCGRASLPPYPYEEDSNDDDSGESTSSSDEFGPVSYAQQGRSQNAVKLRKEVRGSLDRVTGPLVLAPTEIQQLTSLGNKNTKKKTKNTKMKRVIKKVTQVITTTEFIEEEEEVFESNSPGAWPIPQVCQANGLPSLSMAPTKYQYVGENTSNTPLVGSCVDAQS